MVWISFIVLSLGFGPKLVTWFSEFLFLSFIVIVNLLSYKMVMWFYRVSIMMHFMVTSAWMRITSSKLKLGRWKLLRYCYYSLMRNFLFQLFNYDHLLPVFVLVWCLYGIIVFHVQQLIVMHTANSVKPFCSSVSRKNRKF